MTLDHLEPMLAEARRAWPREATLPGHLVAEQKPDAFRCVLFDGPGRALDSLYEDIAHTDLQPLWES